MRLFRFSLQTFSGIFHFDCHVFNFQSLFCYWSLNFLGVTDSMLFLVLLLSKYFSYFSGVYDDFGETFCSLESPVPSTGRGSVCSSGRCLPMLGTFPPLDTPGLMANGAACVEALQGQRMESWVLLQGTLWMAHLWNASPWRLGCI